MLSLTPITASSAAALLPDRADAAFLSDLAAEQTGDVTVIDAPGPRFCGPLADRFARTTTPIARANPDLVVDLAGVTTIDAAGLRALAALARACRAAGGELRLCGPTRAVRLLIAAAGLHDLAEVFPTRRHALLAATPDIGVSSSRFHVSSSEGVALGV